MTTIPEILAQVKDALEAIKYDYGGEMGMNERALRAYARDANEAARQALDLLDRIGVGKVIVHEFD